MARDWLRKSEQPIRSQVSKLTQLLTVTQTYEGFHFRKDTVDWFAGTIEIKKDVIQPYGDYNSEVEQKRTVTIKEEVDVFCSEDEDSLDSASVLGSKRSRFCKSCEAPIIGRNLFLENLSRVTFQS